MKDKNKDDDSAEESPFNGSLDTLARINNLIEDISFYNINSNIIGLKANLYELLIEGQGCLNKSEFKKAWEDWEKLDKIEIELDYEKGTYTFDDQLIIFLQKFNQWLRLKLYRHNLTMAKSSGSLDKFQMMYKRYGIK